jgi:hypothetical protein
VRSKIGSRKPAGIPPFNDKFLGLLSKQFADSVKGTRNKQSSGLNG